MNERNIANQFETSYPYNKEKIVMSAADSGLETSENQPKATNKGEGHTPTRSEAPKPNVFVQKMESVFGEIPKGKPRSEKPLVSFGDAATAAGIINPIRDEKRVVIAPASQDLLKRILRSSGKLIDEDIEKLGIGELIVAAQFALQRSVVDRPKESDFMYSPGTPERKAEVPFITQSVAIAQRGDEEILTPEKVEEYTVVQPHRKLTGIDRQMIGEYVRKIKSGEIGEDVISSLPLHLQEEIRSKSGISKLLETDQAVEEQAVEVDLSRKPEEIPETPVEQPESPEPEVISTTEEQEELPEKILPQSLGGGEGNGEEPPESPTTEDSDDFEDEENEEEGEVVSAGNLRKLINEKWKLIEANSTDTQRLGQIDAAINLIVNSKNPLIVYKSLRSIREVDSIIKGDSQKISEFSSIISSSQIKELEKTKIDFDEQFTEIDKKLSKAARESMTKDISEKTQQFLQALTYGSVNPEAIEKEVLRLLANNQHLELPGYEGYRIWFAEKAIENFKAQAKIAQRGKIHASPEANISAAIETMTYFESLRGSAEDFGMAYQRLNALIEAIKSSKHPEADLIERRIEAFKRVNQVLLFFRDGDGNPEKMTQLMSQLHDEDLHFFYQRFNSAEDTDGNTIILKDKDGKQLNLLSEAENTIILELLQDRFRAEYIEKLQTRKLEVEKDNGENTTTNADIRNIRSRLQGLIDKKFEGLSPGSKPTVDQIWESGKGDIVKIGDVEISLSSIKQTALEHWYKDETLLGQSGFYGDTESTTGKKGLKGELREDVFVRGKGRARFAALLEKREVDQETINRLTGGENEELMDALMHNALNLARWKLVGTLDRFRVYSYGDKHKDYKGEMRNDHIETIINNRTPFLEHVSTHSLDDMTRFKHGDPRVLALVRDMLDDTRGGSLLPQNSVAVRMVGWGLYGPGEKSVIDGKIQAAMRAEGTTEPKDVDAYIVHNELMQGINPDKADKGSVIKLYNTNWEETSKLLKPDVLIDLYDDKNKGLKWSQDAFRKFTYMPDEEKLIAMLDGYYSMRNVRRHMASEIFSKIYWETGHKMRDWFGYKDNLSSADMEVTLQQMEEKNLISRERGEKLKNELLGHTFRARTPRQIAELMWQGAKDNWNLPIKVTWSAFWAMFIEFFKRLPGVASK